MRDAAGELADRLHFLALRELRLEAFLLGGVDDVQHQAGFVVRLAFEPADEQRRPGLARRQYTDIDRTGGGAAGGGLGDVRLRPARDPRR